MRLPDFWTGLALAAFGLAIALIARGFPVPAGAASPRLFPTIIGAAMALMGAAIALRGFRNAADFTMPEWLGKPRRMALMAYLPLAIIIFALIAPTYGTIAVAVPIMIVHCMIYGLKPLPAVAMGLFAGTAIPLAFGELLGIPLPYGVIEELL